MRTLLLGLLVLGSLRAAEEPAPILAPELPGPGNRYLVIVETSKEMKRLQKVAAETVSGLFLNGFNGRIRANDWVALWTFSDTVATDPMPMRPWVPAEQVTLGSQAYRMVSGAKLAKSPNMVEAVEAIKDEVVKRGVVTVILVSSGSAPLEGTPMDRRINDVTGPNRERMQQAGKPFVIVFVTKDGKFLNSQVTPGGQPVYLPPLPKPPPTKPVVTNDAATVVTNKPKSRSVAEIQEELRRQAKPTNTAPAPLIGVDPLFVKAPEATLPAGPATEPAAAAPATNAVVAVPSPATTNLAVVPRPESSVVTPTVTSAPPPKTEVTAASVLTATPGAPSKEVATQTPPPVIEKKPAQPSPSSQAPTQPDPDAAPTVSAAAAADIAKPAPGTAPPRRDWRRDMDTPLAAAPRWNSDLVTGGLLLLAALALGWVLIRNLRSKPDVSLISRSLDPPKR